MTQLRRGELKTPELALPAYFKKYGMIVKNKRFFYFLEETNEKWSASKHSGHRRSRKKPPKQPVPINSITIRIHAKQLLSLKVKEQQAIVWRLLACTTAPASSSHE
jgi:hypothetical protein